MSMGVPRLSFLNRVLGKDFYQSPRKAHVHKTSTHPKSKGFPSSSSQTVGVTCISCLGGKKTIAWDALERLSVVKSH